MSGRVRTRGFVAGDLLLVLAVGAIVLALALPSIRRARVREAADAASTDVETVRAAALELHARSGAWPAPVGTHELPPHLASSLPDSARTSPRPYRLGWRVWEILDKREEPAPEPPPPAPLPPVPADTVAPPAPSISQLGGIEVTSGDPRILAALLERYASERVYVRDSTLTLLLGASGGGR